PYGVEKPTGVFFDKQDVSSVIQAIEKFETVSDTIEPTACRENSVRFSSERFQNEFSNYLNNRWDDFLDRKRIQY
ncbi:glycosyltransferase family 4 protein, partial [Klebsiella pneumoniae]